MWYLDRLGEGLSPFAPVLIVVAVLLAVWLAARWLLLRRGLALEQERRLPRQIGLFGIAMAGVVGVILALPVQTETRNQLLTVFGLLASGIIALASTTLVANAMAGLMLRSTRGFRTGDFIRVEGHFGRVTERGLLDTEIQTEDRELTMLPNLYLITHPVTVVRTSGTLVSVTLTLGYDAHHAAVEPLLIEAARRAELDDPFVRVLELGNFAIAYRVSGFLTDIKNLLTVRSNLCKTVLDVLHAGGIEIASPSIMAQRPMPPETRFVPPVPVPPTVSNELAAEDLMFDKAERAERIAGHRLRLEAEVVELEGQLKAATGEDAAKLKQEIAARRKKLAALAHAAK